MGVGDSGTLGWIADEIAYIAGAVSAGVPYWGVCLGAQLLAAALGAKVYRSDRPEVGIGSVSLTPDAAMDPVFGALPESFLCCSGTATRRPPGGRDPACQLGDTPPPGVQGWQRLRTPVPPGVPARAGGDVDDIDAYRESLTSALGPDGPAILLAGLRAQFPQLARAAQEVMTSWLDTYVLTASGAAEARAQRAARPTPVPDHQRGRSIDLGRWRDGPPGSPGDDL